VNRPRLDPLPIDEHLLRIAAAVRERGAAVVIAPPGSGKTTRIPPALLDSRLAEKGRVIVLQPRRIAAKAAAARIASERGWTLGREAGYQVRFERRASTATRIEVVTEGILARRLQSNPFLEGISAVVLDEFHERSIHTDLSLALLREVREGPRPDLAILVLSATLDPAPVAAFLGDCPVITAGGRPYPVEVRYLERPDRSPVTELAGRALEEAWSGAKGHALVFLPGIGEIRRMAREIEAFARAIDAAVLPLHGSLSLAEQEAALAPSRRRKIVLATNIAETSLTIDGIDLVIDSGWARILRSDPRHGIDHLELSRIGKHSAEQRSGRAGRLGPGTAIRLWTEAEHAKLPDAEPPEVQRVDLASAVLELRAWGSDARAFRWFEAPPAWKLDRAETLLIDLGALDGPRGAPTPVGKRMLEVPAHPRLARVVIEAARRGRGREGAALAALIGERDIVPFADEPRSGRGSRAARETGPSDLLARLDLLEAAERSGFRSPGVDGSRARAVARTRDLLARSARDQAPDAPSRGDDDLLRALLLGYPDRVVRRRSPTSSRGLMVGGRGVILAEESIVRDSELYLAIEVDAGADPAPGRPGTGADALVRVASAVRREWIEDAFPDRIEERTSTAYDNSADRVRATAAVHYRDLPLEEPRDRRPDPEEAARLLAAAARPRALELFLAHETAAPFLRRALWLKEWMPELDLPALDAGDLGTIIPDACAGKVSLAEVRRSDLEGLLRGRLDRVQLAAIERHAPETWTVPAGRAVRLEYEPGKPPVLAARLQELFGLAETPSIAGGRVRLLLHILGPNNRPVQVTQDLRSFWNTTYARVRKDLRARYPKHAWPEDPWTAQPESRPRRRR